MRIPDCTGVVAVFATLWLAGPARADELPSPLRLSDVVDVLRRHNPELSARRAMARAAQARPRTVTQLDDPTVSLEWWQQPIDFAMVPLMVTVRQPLPWPGKLRARGAVAERETSTARDQIVEVERKLEAEAKKALLDVALAERSIGINEREHTILEAMVQVAQAKYRVGRAPQTSILKTQEELLTVDNDRLDLDRARDEARARLNALLDRDPAAPLPPAALPTRPVTLPSAAELVRVALQHRPEVKLAEDAIRQAEAKLALARRDTDPELAVWAGYMVNFRGVDTFTTGVSTTLPIFSARRRSGSTRAAEAELQAARALLQSAQRRTEADIRTALLQMDAALRHEKLHSEKLIPLSELSLKSALAAYQNDRIDLFSVLDAARMLREHHLDHERYLVEYQKRLADLELAAGVDFAREAP
jgi:outer membrane protein TolC